MRVDDDAPARLNQGGESNRAEVQGHRSITGAVSRQGPRPTSRWRVRPRPGSGPLQSQWVMPVFAGMNARHARLGSTSMGTITTFEHEGIDEGFEAGGTRVTPLPSASAHRARQALANIAAVVCHHRQALSQLIFYIGEFQRPSIPSSHPATPASAR